MSSTARFDYVGMAEVVGGSVHTGSLQLEQTQGALTGPYPKQRRQ